jgi:methionyl-tRNA formyltransferase
MIAMVVASKSRWDIFRKTLSGNDNHKVNPVQEGLTATKKIASRLLNLILKKDESNDCKVSDISNALKRRKIPVWSVFDVNHPDFLERVRQLNPDLILSAAYPQIFSKDLIEIPSRGSINFHPSLLPKYRGAHPHFWVIVRGEMESGLTAHFMTEKIDAGDIIVQVAFPISEYNYNHLYQKMIAETPELVKKVAHALEEGKPPIPQDTNNATMFRNDREIHRRIFWNIHTAEEIKNLSRTDEAFCFFRGNKVKLLHTYVTDTNRNLTNDVRVEPGTIVDVSEDCIAVKTVNACININSFSDGRKQLSFDRWIRKHRIHIGEKFE